MCRVNVTVFWFWYCSIKRLFFSMAGCFETEDFISPYCCAIELLGFLGYFFQCDNKCNVCVGKRVGLSRCWTVILLRERSIYTLSSYCWKLFFQTIKSVVFFLKFVLNLHILFSYSFFSSSPKYPCNL